MMTDRHPAFRVRLFVIFALLVAVMATAVGCSGSSQTTDSRVLNKLDENLEQTYAIQQQLDELKAAQAAGGGGENDVLLAEFRRFDAQTQAQLEAIYGNTESIALAVGETRMVATANNSCLRARPSASTQYEPIFCMEPGTPIFRCRNADSDGWMSGLIFREGKAHEIFFSMRFTQSYMEWQERNIQTHNLEE